MGCESSTAATTTSPRKDLRQRAPIDTTNNDSNDNDSDNDSDNNNNDNNDNTTINNNNKNTRQRHGIQQKNKKRQLASSV